MKKFAVIFGAFAALALVAACGTTAAATVQAPPSDVPEWYLVPPTAEDAIYGVGSAKMQTTEASRTFAESRARTAIARAINARVQNMITDYMSGSEGSNTPMANFQESVTRSLTDATLSGTKVEKAGVGRDGTIYILMSIPTSEARQQAIAKIGENPNRALAQQALRNMDQAFSSQYNQPSAPVSE